MPVTKRAIEVTPTAAETGVDVRDKPIVLGRSDMGRIYIGPALVGLIWSRFWTAKRGPECRTKSAFGPCAMRHRAAHLLCFDEPTVNL